MAINICNPQLNALQYPHLKCLSDEQLDCIEASVLIDLLGEDTPTVGELRGIPTDERGRRIFRLTALLYKAGWTQSDINSLLTSADEKLCVCIGDYRKQLLELIWCDAFSALGPRVL